MTHRFVARATALSLCASCTAPPADVVSPSQRDLYFRSSDHFQIHADLGASAISRQPVDILLLFDRTGSMHNVIDKAQRNADEIVTSILTLFPNTAFAVAGLADYDAGDHAWQLYQDVTVDRSSVTVGLNRIAAASGGDTPEAYARALYEARLIGWRVGARKYAVLFGDAPAHDPAFYGTDFGVDPGRDEVRGTADDLRLEPVVADLAHDSIAVIAIYDGSRSKPYHDETLRGFEFIARQTGGVSVPLTSALDVVHVIQQGLLRLVQPAPSLVVPTAYATWVQAATFNRDVPTANVFHIAVNVEPPRKSPSGVYRFPLTVMRGRADGVDTVGQTWITVRIGALNFPWRLPLLLAFLFSLFAWAVSRVRPNAYRFIRYERNWPFLRLFARLVAVALIVGGAMAIWHYAPGTLPPVPSPVGRDPP